jgi:hypothetical protein
MDPAAEALEKPLPKPGRDLLGYASARALEALLEALLALEFLEKGYTRNAAGKALQAWKALTATLLALNVEAITSKLPEEEARWLRERALARVPTSRLKQLSELVEEVAGVPYYSPLTAVVLDLHDYQYHGPDPDMELSKYRSRREAAHDIAYVVGRIVEIVEHHVKPRLQKRWTSLHEDALRKLSEKLQKLQETGRQW